MTRLIDAVTLPQGLRDLSVHDLATVCHEVRDELISVVAESGGHFASSLGATELSVGLHAVFSTPDDRLIWDVGHQGYVHKFLTGRRELLPTVRKQGGISGFLRRDESPYDAFGAGHAGTSISAAVGFAVALREQAPQRKVVAIIGDGSMTAGMAFEALNHAGDLKLGNLIVVLNDNEMSISPNVGALSRLFSHAVTSQHSTRWRRWFKSLHARGWIPSLVYKIIDRAEEATQAFLSTPAQLFESFGFRYIGPINGNDVGEVVRALRHAREQEIPVLVHARTVKGKGYEPAEKDPVAWHGVVPFKRHEGVLPKSGGGPTYTSVFADTLIQIAKGNRRVVGVTAAMLSGTGLEKMHRELPQQCFDVGICEQHAVTFAAGLACEGYRPVCAIYSTFLQRAFDQVVHDVAIQKLPVVFAIDRAGVVGNDGETHQGVFDIAYLRTIPNLVIAAPKDENELRHLLWTGVNHDGPFALRYPRGNSVGVALDGALFPLPIGVGEVLVRGEGVVLVACGPDVQVALAVGSEILKILGVQVSVVNARWIKPLDHELLRREALRHGAVVTIEDHALQGGFGSAVLESLSEVGITTPVYRCGVGDEFVPHASQKEQRELHRYDAASIATLVKGLIGEARIRSKVA